jgi:adenylyl-sulfate kinase
MSTPAPDGIAVPFPLGAVLWLTGCPASGKSTLARALERVLADMSRRAVILDGDAVRRGLSADLDFSQQARSENARRVTEVALLLANAGIVAIVALVSPFAADRREARRRASAHDPAIAFLEVYLDAPLEVREARDSQGLYRRARALEIRDFTGLTGEYEVPAAADVHLHTDLQTVDECVAAVLERLPPRV